VLSRKLHVVDNTHLNRILFALLVGRISQFSGIVVCVAAYRIGIETAGVGCVNAPKPLLGVMSHGRSKDNKAFSYLLMTSRNTPRALFPALPFTTTVPGSTPNAYILHVHEYTLNNVFKLMFEANLKVLILLLVREVRDFIAVNLSRIVHSASLAFSTVILTDNNRASPYY